MPVVSSLLHLLAKPLGKYGECSTFFQVNDGKSMPIIGIDYAASGEIASHLGSFLTILEIGAALLQKKKR
jgi:hypothetical protein